MYFSFFRRKENVRKANVEISKLSKGRNYQEGPEIKSGLTRHSMIGGPNGAFVQINVKLPDSKPADLLQFVVSAKSMKKHIAMPKVKKQSLNIRCSILGHCIWKTLILKIKIKSRNLLFCLFLGHFSLVS